MSGLDALLVSGGAQWIVGEVASEVSSQVEDKLRGHLCEGEPNLSEAQQVARENDAHVQFQEALDDFEEKTGAEITEYTVRRSDDTQSV